MRKFRGYDSYNSINVRSTITRLLSTVGIERVDPFGLVRIKFQQPFIYVPTAGKFFIRLYMPNIGRRKKERCSKSHARSCDVKTIEFRISVLSSRRQSFPTIGSRKYRQKEEGEKIEESDMNGIGSNWSTMNDLFEFLDC